MAVFKCKMCGGTFETVEGSTVAECEYCGNKITIGNGKHETVHRIVDEAKLKELENIQKTEDAQRAYIDKKEKSVFKTKMILLAIWVVIVSVLWILSSCTADDVGFSPYQLLLIPIIIFGVVIIIKEIKKFFKNN